MKELLSLTFQNLDGWITCSPLYYSLAFMIEKHIDKLYGAIPSYLAEVIGCKECPAIKAGKKCVLNMSRGPMPGTYSSGQDRPQFIKLMCSGTTGDGYRPCMQGFDVPIRDVYQAENNGLEAFDADHE